MTRLTLAAVNKAVAAKGIKAELVKGDGYYYFTGDDIRDYSQSVYVYRLNHLTFEAWMNELKEAVVTDKREAFKE